MGLSATQMRFLMVMARKSNVEYQGQQINQARTDLANQTSALYAELLSLKAPSAPSVYTYAINPTTTPVIDWSEDSSWPLSGEAQKNFMVHYAANEPDFRDFNIPEYVEQFDASGNSIGWKEYLGLDDNGKKLYGGTLVTDLSTIKGVYCYKTTGNYATTTKGENGETTVSPTETTYMAIGISSDSNVKYDVESGLFSLKSSTDASGNPISLDKWFQAYNAAIAQYTAHSKPAKTAVYDPDFDVTSLANDATASDKTSHVVSYKLSLGKTSNDYNTAQYNAAMAEYERELKEYEEAYAVINQKTEQIHEIDKKLELQLKQLDTEQESIQTEYEALKKVLDKNIENTFKTFG